MGRFTCTVGNWQRRRRIVIILKVETSLLKGLLRPALGVAEVHVPVRAVHSLPGRAFGHATPVPGHRRLVCRHLCPSATQIPPVRLANALVAPVGGGVGGGLAAFARKSRFAEASVLGHSALVQAVSVACLFFRENWLQSVCQTRLSVAREADLPGSFLCPVPAAQPRTGGPTRPRCEHAFLCRLDSTLIANIHSQLREKMTDRHKIER